MVSRPVALPYSASSPCIPAGSGVPAGSGCRREHRFAPLTSDFNPEEERQGTQFMYLLWGSGGAGADDSPIRDLDCACGWVCGRREVCLCLYAALQLSDLLKCPSRRNALPNDAVSGVGGDSKSVNALGSVGCICE